MDPTDVKIQIARMDERLRVIIEGLQQDRDSRKNQYEKMELLNVTLTEFSNRLSTLESNFARSAPTIEEFITIKHKVVGAGIAGKWLWIAIGGILGILFSLRMEIIRWLSK